MEITKDLSGDQLTVTPVGRVDTITANELDQALANLAGVNTLILDLGQVPYISSAGLRTILITQKRMGRQGKMKLRNVMPEVLDVFEMTGFSDLLTIE